MEMSSAVQLLEWNEKLLSLLGLWPLSNNDTRFTLGLICLLIHVTLEYVDLYKFGKNFEHVVANLSENITYTTILIQVILLRVNSRQLGQVIRAAYEDFVEINYKTTLEKKVLLDNYKKVRIFVAVAVAMTLSTAVSYYLAPLVGLLGTMKGNSTMELKLPYHTYIFYDVSNIESYALTYAAHLPFVFFASFGYVGPNCLIVTLTVHVFGQLYVLAERINDINTNGQECGLAIKTLVKNHVRLIRMTQTLEEVYNVILLGQLLGGMILICILSYYVLAHAEGEQNSDFFSVTLYILSVILNIFVYCFVGERLVQESTKVHDTLSACRWYDMSSVHAKMLVVCMARSQKPLVLTAGKFYKFSMGSFANVMKTSMAYLSVLRSLL
ncbi:odorant receptor 13a-like [Neodiprion pinetum]|uniref:odorant receptor 13a-like n=1 Tax=Neodiprion pinetum TaxID=441929 RepID=UPI0037208276